MQIGLGLPITRPTGGFNPRVVFGDGSNGLLWDYSATTGLYSDNLGATPLTAPDTGVGLVADRSRVRSPVTAYGGAQASAGLRPVWKFASGFGAARFDRTDDVLSTVLTLAQTGDVAVFGKNGSWRETARAYTAGATFSIGPTTVTGLTAGLLAALGDIVGIVAIGRTLTAAELASTLAYFKARGAAGWLTAGSELITNGGFATDLTGWSVYNGATLTLSSQRMQVANGASGRGGGAQSFATVVGQSYVFSIDVTNGTHPAFIYFGVAAGSGGTYAMSNITGHADAVFVATATTTWVTLMPSSTGVGNTTLFDNVSVKPLTVAA
jgi:hypothetical protein